ncbi:MAG: competence protein ComEA [Gaiellales bacterium]|nr:competence protein ComEA [Gaiellales bacterium]
MLLLLLAGVAVLIVVGRVLPSSSAPAPQLAPALPAGAGGSPAPGVPERGPVVVDVVGAVRHPGVYRLPAGSRARDAVRRAGGARKRADLEAVNLAVLLADGEQVRVPLRAPAGAPAGRPGGAAPAGIVHLNSSSPQELDALDGIGPSLADRIVAYRVAHGGFRSLDELDEVSGIGPKRLESLRPLLAL